MVGTGGNLKPCGGAYGTAMGVGVYLWSLVDQIAVGVGRFAEAFGVGKHPVELFGVGSRVGVSEE